MHEQISVQTTTELCNSKSTVQAWDCGDLAGVCLTFRRHEDVREILMNHRGSRGDWSLDPKNAS